MLVKLLKGKLHQARVTETRLYYAGSIEIDESLMDAVGILPYESVLIADLDSGNRLETYAVPAKAGSGSVVILGPAARLVKEKDTIIVFSFGFYEPGEAAEHKPKVVQLDANNRIKSD